VLVSGQKGFSLAFLDLIDNSSQEKARMKGGISFSPKMEFDGDQILLVDFFLQVGSVEQYCQFIQKRLSKPTLSVRKKTSLFIMIPPLKKCPQVPKTTLSSKKT